MKKISLFLAAALMVLACACNRDAKQSSANGDNNFAFLTKLGINMDSVNVFDKKLVEDTVTPTMALDEKQRVALLNQVHRFDVYPEVEGLCFILGVKAVGHGHTLVVYLTEYGDGSEESMAIYDSEGKLTDFIQTGPWDAMAPQEANDDYTAGTALKWKAECEFTSADEFVLNSSYADVAWKMGADDKGEPGPIEVTDSKWEILKKYRYKIDEAGHFVFLGRDEQRKGPVDAEDVILDDIEDVAMLPVSSEARLDSINSKCVRYAKQPGDMVKFSLSSIMWRIYNSNPQQVLNYIAAHRDAPTEVQKLMESIVSDGNMDKAILVGDIKKMADAGARAYLEQLTAQWGVAGAKG